MTQKINECDQRLLGRVLTEELSESDESRLEQHLTQCDACRRQLEQMAGSDTHLSSIVQSLRIEPMVSPAHANTDAFLPPHAGDTSLSLVDFAVDFLEPASEPGSLGRLGDIEITEVLGQGGMGIVLRGWQRELNRAVAVKVLAPHLASSGAARQRFAREAQAAAAVVHPNVMPIYAVNSGGKLPYLVMPYTQCESLQQRMDRQGALPVLDVTRIGLQVAQALAAAHAQGLVHRDVKPANILLEPGTERALLTDFGLARAADDASLTRTGVIAGTPQYMSPEQARGDAIDARSDLFSLGSVLYAACTGRPPFRAENSYGILRRITDSQPHPIRDLNPGVPEWLQILVGRLMEKQLGDRFASAQEVSDLLQPCLAHLQQPEVMKVPVELQSRRINGHQFFSLRTALLVCLLVFVAIAATTATTAITMRGSVSGRSQRDPARQPDRTPSFVNQRTGAAAASDTSSAIAAQSEAEPADPLTTLQERWDASEAFDGANHQLTEELQRIDDELQTLEQSIDALMLPFE
jgi:serine/threonine-protein kinase